MSKKGKSEMKKKDDKSQVEELKKQVETLQNRIKELKKQASLNIVDWQEFQQLRLSVNIMTLLNRVEKGSFLVDRDLSQEFVITIYDQHGKEVCSSYWFNIPNEYVKKLKGKSVHFAFIKNKFVITKIN